MRIIEGLSQGSKGRMLPAGACKEYISTGTKCLKSSDRIETIELFTLVFDSWDEWDLLTGMLVRFNERSRTTTQAIVYIAYTT